MSDPRKWATGGDWFLRLALDDPNQVDQLMDAQQYQAYVAQLGSPLSDIHTEGETSDAFPESCHFAHCGLAGDRVTLTSLCQRTVTDTMPDRAVGTSHEHAGAAQADASSANQYTNAANGDTSAAHADTCAANQYTNAANGHAGAIHLGTSPVYGHTSAAQADTGPPNAHASAQA